MCIKCTDVINCIVENCRKCIIGSPDMCEICNEGWIVNEEFICMEENQDYEISEPIDSSNNDENNNYSNNDDENNSEEKSEENIETGSCIVNTEEIKNDENDQETNDVDNKIESQTNFDENENNGKNKISKGTIAGISIACVVVVAVVACVTVFILRRKKNTKEHSSLDIELMKL